MKSKVRLRCPSCGHKYSLPKYCGKTVELNDKFVEGLKPSPAQAIYWDTALSSFGVRAGAGGRKTFVTQVRILSKTKGWRQTKIKVGVWPKIKTSKARQIADGIQVLAKAGKDPRTIGKYL